MCFYLINLETQQAKAHRFRSGGNLESVSWGVTLVEVISSPFSQGCWKPTVSCVLLGRWTFLMEDCNADWKVLIEIQVSEAYLRDLLQGHKNC